MSKLVSLIMAFVIFISSTGLVLNKHFCQDQLKSMAIFVAAKSCQHQNTITVPCPIHGTMEVPADEDNNCCDDQTEFLKADQDLISYSFEIKDTEQIQFLVGFAIAFLEEPLTGIEALVDYSQYRPPILVYDRTVRLQTFLC